MKRSLADCVLTAEFRNRLDRDIAPYLAFRANGKGKCSLKMQKDRRQILRLAFAELKQLTYRLQEPRNLKQKHVSVLMKYWDAQGHSANCLHTRHSVLSVFCKWMGKRDVVGHITDHISPERAKRTTIAQADLSWQHHGIDPLERIEKAKDIDPRLAGMLMMQHHFGLRVKESIELHPAHSLVDGGNSLEIFESTKGGRPRLVRVRTHEQRQAFEYVRALTTKGPNGRLRWPDCTFKQAQGRYYRLIRKHLGICRDVSNVTSHGLRHGFAHQGYERDTGGLPPPVAGGKAEDINWLTHHTAMVTGSHELGHYRPMGHYYGSFGHQLRTSKQEPIRPAPTDGTLEATNNAWTYRVTLVTSKKP